MLTMACRVIISLIAMGLAIYLKYRGGKSSMPDSGCRKLWWIHQYAISPDMPEVLRHWELSSLLKAHGWESTVFATAFNHKSRKYVRPVSPLRPVIARNERGVKFRWLYTTPYDGNDVRRYVNMLSFLLVSLVAGASGERPRLVVGTSPNMLAALSAWILSRRYNTPFILEVQDLWPESIVQLGVTNPLVIKPLEVLEKFLYARADHIVSLSEGITNGIIAKGVPAGKITLVSNAAMRTEKLDPVTRSMMRAKLGWDGRTIAIWIGAHGPANGLDTVIEAARLARHRNDILFVLIGDGPEKQKLVKQAVGLPNVVFRDPIPKSDVLMYLQCADIGIMHSRKFDAFTGTRPCKLFDYMAASLPIMTSMPGEAGRLVANANSGVQADWEDAQSIADAIMRLADDGDLRRQLGENGFRFSQTNSREDTAEILAGILSNLSGA